MAPSKKVLVFPTVPPSSSIHFTYTITSPAQTKTFQKQHNKASSSQTPQAGFVSMSHIHIAVWVACSGVCVRIFTCVCACVCVCGRLRLRCTPRLARLPQPHGRFVSERTCWYPPLSLSVHVHGHMVDPPPIGSCRQKTAIHTPIHSSC